MRTVTNNIIGLGLLLLIAACAKEPDYRLIEVPDSPDGTISGNFAELEESYHLRLYSTSSDIDFLPLVIGQCSNVSAYWSDSENFIIAYDKIQLHQFFGSPRYFGGANISFCSNFSGFCPPPASERVYLPLCKDHSI